MKNAQSAVYELLGRFDGTPEASAEAVRMFESIAGYDAATDLRLMVLLHDVAEPAATERALELLKGLSEGSKLLRSLSGALAEGDAELRQSAGKKLAGAALRFREQHLRRRADAVETLAAHDTPEIREILWELARSEGNRVAANALLALYWMSDTRVFAEFRQMALHPDRHYRASAVWAVGKTGDQRFSELLLKLLEDPEPGIRRAAFTVLRNIKEKLTRAAGAPPLPVKILKLSADGQERRAWIVARDPESRGGLELPSRAFIIREGGAPVEGYEVERVRPEGPVNIGLLVVGTYGQKDRDRENEFLAAEQGISLLVDQKRPEDRCAVLKLRSGGTGAPVAASEVELIAQTWLLRRVSAQPAGVMDASGRASAAGLRRLIEELRDAPGPRYLFCCFPSPVDTPTNVEEIVAEAAAAGIVVSVIVLGGDEPPAPCVRLAEGTSGVLYVARSAEALRDSWRLLYQAIVGSYVVRWPGAGDPGPVSLRLSTGAAVGNAVWPEPSPAAVAA